jgi:hypothetical protein
MLDILGGPGFVQPAQPSKDMTFMHFPSDLDSQCDQKAKKSRVFGVIFFQKSPIFPFQNFHRTWKL